MSSPTARGYAALAVLALCIPGTHVAYGDPVFGQLDDFSDGTTMGWSEGIQSPSPPTNVADGGPTGVGDNFLQIDSAGGSGAGSRQTTFNVDTRWTGDYVSAGVTGITVDMSVISGANLPMRFVLSDAPITNTGGAGTVYVTSTPITLPADGNWHNLHFNLDTSSLSDANGGGTPLANVLTSVAQVRFVSASDSSVQPWKGDQIASSLGIDNITAVPEPSAFFYGGLVFVAAYGGRLIQLRFARRSSIQACC